MEIDFYSVFIPMTEVYDTSNLADEHDTDYWRQLQTSHPSSPLTKPFLQNMRQLAGEQSERNRENRSAIVMVGDGRPAPLPNIYSPSKCMNRLIRRSFSVDKNVPNFQYFKNMINGWVYLHSGCASKTKSCHWMHSDWACNNISCLACTARLRLHLNSSSHFRCVNKDRITVVEFICTADPHRMLAVHLSSIHNVESCDPQCMGVGVSLHFAVHQIFGTP
jgi:hypothetical protein